MAGEGWRVIGWLCGGYVCEEDGYVGDTCARRMLLLSGGGADVPGCHNILVYTVLGIISYCCILITIVHRPWQEPNGPYGPIAMTPMAYEPYSHAS